MLKTLQISVQNEFDKVDTWMRSDILHCPKKIFFFCARNVGMNLG